MEKYCTITAYLEANNMTREDLKEMIARAAVYLCTDCNRNFDGSPEITERVEQPLFYFLEMIETVD